MLIPHSSHYRYWRITFFAVYAGVVFAAGWYMRGVSTYNQSSLPIYIAATVLIYAGPPIYAAAEYNMLGRLMHYVPMHAPLHPGRVLIVFIYLGAIVESLTGTGAARIAQTHDLPTLFLGAKLISISLLLQAVVELGFMCTVAYVHTRCARSGMLTPNIRTQCITLYGTSTVMFFRCVLRAIEVLTSSTSTHCSAACHAISGHEWYLYVFELLPTVIYAFWLNWRHPGKFLPREKTRYLDFDAKTERIGPGWIDRRTKWQTYGDPLDIRGRMRGQPSHEEFWLQSEKWPACETSFALGTGSNVKT